LWDRLRNFDETDARQRLKPFLRGAEIDALFKRRLKIIDHINKMIQQRETLAAMTRFLQRLFNLQPGEVGRSILLFSYLFLVMLCYLVARVLRDALFLDKFEAVDLPYADLSIFLCLWFVVSGYLLIGRHINLKLLLIGSTLFFSSNALLCWYLVHFFPSRWLIPAFYIWTGIFGVVAPAQVWTLANYVLTPREAKRIFGIVASGAISGAIVGGNFSNIMAINLRRTIPDPTTNQDSTPLESKLFALLNQCRPAFVTV
jgi:ATP/ADP translocase